MQLPAYVAWEIDGAPHVAAVVRAAAAALARPRLVSSGFRGQDTLGIGSIRASGDSSIWYSQTDMHSWTVGLGLDSIQGRVFDWQLTAIVTSSASASAPMAQLVTGDALTVDGALVNARPYDELRIALERDLPLTAPANVDAERSVGERGLALPAAPLTTADRSPDDAPHTVSVALKEDAVRERLRLLHFPVAGPDTWSIGPSGSEQNGQVRLELVDDGQRRVLHFHVRLPSAEHPLARAVAARQASRLVTIAHGVLAKQDETATYNRGARA